MSKKSERQGRRRRDRQQQEKGRQEGRRRTQARKKRASTPFPRVASEPADRPAEPLRLPSRTSIERKMRELHRLLEEQQVADEDDLDAFIAESNARGAMPLPNGGRPKSKSWAAQETAYEAMEAEDAETAVRLATRAVELDSQCVDALVILAHAGSESPEELIENLGDAVSAGERALGADFFEENRGYFWGLIETRPYMRARQDLADTLRKAGRVDEAVAHYEAMLELNPNDNQGIRDILLACYLSAGDLHGTRRLFEQYEKDASALFQWSRVLERLLAGDEEKAGAILADARKDNPFVEAYLTGKKPMPRILPDYYSPGDVSEAKYVAVSLRPAWRSHPSSVEWLQAQAETG